MVSGVVPEKIDVYGRKHEYEMALAKFKQESNVCAVKKEYILEFLRDCQLGKTVLKRQKKRIKEKRLLKNLQTLKRLNQWFMDKDFKRVTQKEMEDSFLASTKTGSQC